MQGRSQALSSLGRPMYALGAAQPGSWPFLLIGRHSLPRHRLRSGLSSQEQRRREGGASAVAPDGRTDPWSGDHVALVRTGQTTQQRDRGRCNKQGVP
jgi:hypothetical protein